MKLAIVMPVKDQLTLTKEALRSLEANTETDWGLVLVDNGCKDKTVSWVTDFCTKKKIPLIVEPFDRTNLSKVWNLGVARARNEWKPTYLAVVNNDIVVGERWWRPFEYLFETADVKQEVWCAVPRFTRLEKPIDFKHQVREALKRSDVSLAPQTGFFMVFRSDVFTPQKIGIFDERFRLWYGDTDYWYRLQEANHPPVLINAVLIHHYESKTLNEHPNKTSIIQEDENLFAGKWGPKPPTSGEADDGRIGVTIAVPTMGYMRTELVNVLMRSMKDERYKLTFLTTNGVSFHDFARNTLVQDFLEKTSDEWIIFIDADIIPPLDFLKLLDHKKPIVGAVCYTFVGGNLQATIYEKTGEHTYEPNKAAQLYSGLVETPVTGFGCIAIKREVLEKMSKPYFQFEYDPETRHRTLGEDIYFCEQATKLGYTIYVDTDVFSDHMKELSMQAIFKLNREYTTLALKHADEERKALARELLAKRHATTNEKTNQASK